MTLDPYLVPFLINCPCRKKICNRRYDAAVIAVIIVGLGRSVVLPILIRKLHQKLIRKQQLLQIKNLKSAAQQNLQSSENLSSEALSRLIQQ